jgi:heat-inducible transcriptional repressor
VLKEGEKMDERQQKLLKEIVESYIKTVKPVGSKSLCKKFNCSSATIRNEMAVLENLGFIEKNHISSGRIPSESGYKYYVENLMEPKELTGEDVLKLQTIFKNNELELSDSINKCVEIISELTNYTSIVLGKSSLENHLQQVNIIPISDNKIVALVCTDKGIVENKQYIVNDKAEINEIVKTSEIINKMLVGTPINEVSQRLEFEVKPIISRQIKEYETVYNIFASAFNDFLEKSQNVHVAGKNKIFDEPEYNDALEIKKLANKFEDENFIKKIEEDSLDNDIKIYIGEENDFDPNVTIIKSKYNLNGEEGTIAIVGPKRMEYDRVVGLLSYIQDALNEKK